MSMELTEKNKIKLEALMLKYVDVKERSEKIEIEKRTISSLILKALQILGLKSYSIEAEGDCQNSDIYLFTLVTKAKVDYNVKEVKRAVGKKVFKKISSHNISIDYDAFVELAKKYKIPREEAMSCLHIQESVDGVKLQKLFETGEIDLSQLKGTYTVDKQSYISLRKLDKAKV